MSELVSDRGRGHVRHLILDRPEKRNAFNADLVLELREAAREAADDHDVWCVVLRGEGAAFSAGIDVFQLGGLAGTENLRPFRRTAIEMVNLLEEMTKPVVAQIHGACLGLGAELALACDLRVMADDVKFGLPETKLGLIPDVGGSSRLPGRRGPRHREGAADDRPHDRRGRVLPDRRGEPRRAGGGARGGHAGAGRRAAGGVAAGGRASRSASPTGSPSRRSPHRSSRRCPTSRSWSRPTTSARPAPRSWRSASRASRARRRARRRRCRRPRRRKQRQRDQREHPGEVRVAPVVRRELHGEQDRRAERRHAARVRGQRAVAPHAHAGAGDRRRSPRPGTRSGRRPRPAASTGRAASRARPGRRRRRACPRCRRARRAATSTTGHRGRSPTAAPTSARPRRRAAAIHSGTSASGASFTHPAAVSAAVEPSASASATSAAGDHVVRPARRRDHHGREGEHRERGPRAVAAGAPHGDAERARRDERERRSPPTGLRPGCRSRRAPARSARPGRRRGTPAADRCRRAPARPARGCRRAARRRAASSRPPSTRTRRRSPARRGSRAARARPRPPRRTARRTPRDSRSNTNTPPGLARAAERRATRSAPQVREQHGRREHAPLQVALVQQHDRHDEGGQRRDVEVLDPPQRKAQRREQEQRQQPGQRRRSLPDLAAERARARPRSGSGR